MQQNHNSILLDMLSASVTKTTPIWFMRQAGRALKSYRKLRENYSFLQMCTIPELIAKTTILPVDELGVDAAILFSDILIPLLAAGAKLFYKEGQAPIVEIDLENFHYDGVEQRLRFVQNGIKQIKSQTKVPLIGFAAAPFTLFCYLFNDTKFYTPRAFIYQNPRAFESIMHTITQLTIEYLNLQIESGCNCFQLFDSWAGILPASIYKKFVLKYNNLVFQSCKIPSIYFSHSSEHLLSNILSINAWGYSFDWKVDLKKITKKTSKCLQGNLDNTILFSDKHTIKKHAIDLIKSMRNKPYIFNLGHGVLPNTPEYNLKYLVDVVHGFNAD